MRWPLGHLLKMKKAIAKEIQRQLQSSISSVDVLEAMVKIDAAWRGAMRSDLGLLNLLGPFRWKVQRCTGFWTHVRQNVTKSFKRESQRVSQECLNHFFSSLRESATPLATKQLDLA